MTDRTRTQALIEYGEGLYLEQGGALTIAQRDDLFVKATALSAEFEAKLNKLQNFNQPQDMKDAHGSQAGIAGLVERLRSFAMNESEEMSREVFSGAADALARMEGELAQLHAEWEQDLKDAGKDVQRYNFLKSRIEIPGAIHHFLGLNNWHPDTDLRNIDAAIDEAIEAAKSDEAQP